MCSTAKLGRKETLAPRLSRKQGFSRATIYKLIEELKKDNVTEVYLWCEKSLEDFYKKIGFTKIGNVYIETEF